MTATAAAASRMALANVARRSGPILVVEGLGPVTGFYLGYRLSGVPLAVALASAVAGVVFLLALRSGRRGVLVLLSLVLSLTQAAATLLSGNPRVYFVQPVITDLVLGIAFAVSVALRMPIAGAVARDVFPVDPEVGRSPAFVRACATISAVWAVYYAARSAARLAILLSGASVGLTAVLYGATSTPFTAVVMTWSIWYAARRLPGLVPPQPGV